MIAPSIPAGGHISHGKKEHSGTAGLVHGLEIEFYPFDAEEMTIDVDKTKQKVEELKKINRLPKMAMFGGSLFLFPHPVKELADFLKSFGMHINYDAAHVAGLIAGGKFQDPLREGADTMTMSTHKTLFGPQGGLVLGSEKHEDAIKKAKVFAEALSNAGFKVLWESRGFTESHQVAVNVLDYSDGGKVEADLEKANIIVNRQLIPGDIKAGRNYFHPGGIRLGVSEITRLGMKQDQMKEIASYIKEVVIEKKDPKKILSKVKAFRKNYQKVHYCFDNKLGAYEYVKLR